MKNLEVKFLARRMAFVLLIKNDAVLLLLCGPDLILL